jgi:cytochrome c-type biogenesis protein CcmH/NrfG
VRALRKFLQRRKQNAVEKRFWAHLEAQPTNAQIWANLGYFYIEIGRPEKAQLCVERLETINVEQAELLQRAIAHPELRSRGVTDLFSLS